MKVKIRINKVPIHNRGQLGIYIYGKEFETRDYHCDDKVKMDENAGCNGALSDTGMNRIFGKPYKGVDKNVLNFDEVDGFELDVEPDKEIVFGLTKFFKAIPDENGEIVVDFPLDYTEITDEDKNC